MKGLSGSGIPYREIYGMFNTKHLYFRLNYHAPIEIEAEWRLANTTR